MPSVIHKVWTFTSSSRNKTYQTLQYSDGSTSCDCPGWTRRAPKNAQNAIVRTCRHTRAVDLGQADAEAINFHEYPKPHKAMLHTGEIVTVQGSRPQYGNRKLCI